MAVLLGVVAMSSAAAVVSGLFWFGRQVHLAEELPVKGVDVSVSADEERSVGPNGEVRIRHKGTGRLRVVRVEGAQTPLPEWLTLPSHSVRVEAWSRWGSGRREAMFRYMVPLSAVDFHDRFERVLEWERWEARTLRTTTLAVVNGVHKRLDRELLMSARPMTEDSVEVTIRLTEPEGR